MAQANPARAPRAIIQRKDAALRRLASAPGFAPIVICPLCHRPLGARVEDHHLVPRTYKGRETVALHPICHRKIHATFTERELKDRFHTIDLLLEHPDIRTFVTWISARRPDFHDRTATSRALKEKRAARGRR